MGKFQSTIQVAQTAIELGRTAQGLADSTSNLRHGTPGPNSHSPYPPPPGAAPPSKRDLGRQAGHTVFTEGADAGKTMGKTWLKTFEVIPRLVCRGLQLVFALVVCGFYGNRVDADRRGDGGYSPEWIFALVIAGLSAVTAVLFVAAAPLSALPVIGSRVKMLKTYRAFGWDVTLFLTWIIVFGIFAGIFLGRDSDDRYKGSRTGPMKVAVWIDLVNAILWLVSGTYGAFKTFLGDKADRMTDKVGKKLFEKKEKTPAKDDGYAESV